VVKWDEKEKDVLGDRGNSLPMAIATQPQRTRQDWAPLFMALWVTPVAFPSQMLDGLYPLNKMK